MFYGTAIQIASATHDGESQTGVSATQVILIPAAREAWVRNLSDEHPRKTWGRVSYTTDLFTLTGVPAALGAAEWADYSTGLRDRVLAGESVLTHDVPVLFHVTDDEALELRSGVMPRNIPLRFQRAVEAVGATVIGSGASPLLGVVNDREYDSLSFATGDNVANRVTGTMDALTARINEDRTATLDRYVPPAAVAKGGGTHMTSERADAFFAAHPEADEAREAAAEAEAETVAPPVALPTGDDKCKPGTSLTRPNGLPYVAREVKIGVKGVSDVDLMRAAKSHGKHIALYGEPGTGKTALLEVAFPGLITVVCSADTEAGDLMGSYVITMGEEGREALAWRDGPVTRAAIEGKTVLLDEISMVAPNQLTALFALMDGRTTFTIPQNPSRGTLHVKEGFSVVAAWNPNAPGSRVSEALLSRFGVKAEFTTDYAVMRSLGVNERMVSAAEHMDKQRQNDEISWAPQARELLAFKDDESNLGLTFALNNLLANVPYTEVPVVKAHLLERFGDLLRNTKIVGPLTI
jgi:nitric oxide reductase NorQ protein